ncbi:MAG: hypothetical protein KKF89_05485 [Nanoarchaeota archaeon]|nr:hypothetical protein [Nanoarchaeota archaeon]MBU1855148.1 hypothetical protein [Nanoarchaeota archaeon]
MDKTRIVKLEVRLIHDSHRGVFAAEDIPYETEDENEEFYVKDEKELWIEISNFNNMGFLFLAITRAYLESKKLERATTTYLERFENIVSFYV